MNSAPSRSSQVGFVRPVHSSRSIVLGALFLAILFAMPAHADIHQVGKTYISKGGEFANPDSLCLATIDGAQKFAALVAAVTGGDGSKPPDKLVIAFVDKSDWKKFAALWSKARATKPPIDQHNDTEIGSYFDPYDKTEVEIYVNSRGRIEFTMGGIPNSDNVPTVISLFELIPADFKSFDEDVAKVTAYFAS